MTGCFCFLAAREGKIAAELMTPSLVEGCSLLVTPVRERERGRGLTQRSQTRGGRLALGWLQLSRVVNSPGLDL